jgi:hypothetical protein
MSYTFTKIKYFSSLLLISSFLFLQSCRKNDIEQPVTQPAANNTSAQVATEWMDQVRLVVKAEGKNPPQASRIYAYAAIALYESVVPGMQGYKSLQNQVPGLTDLPDARAFGEVDYITVVNEAMYHLNLGLFPKLQQYNANSFEALRNKSLSCSSTTPTRLKHYVISL